MWAVLFGAVLATGAAENPRGADSAAAGAQSTAEDKIICRRMKVTGSHVKRERVCHTASEWEKMAKAHREHWEQEALQNSGKPGGN